MGFSPCGPFVGLKNIQRTLRPRHGFDPDAPDRLTLPCSRQQQSGRQNRNPRNHQRRRTNSSPNIHNPSCIFLALKDKPLTLSTHRNRARQLGDLVGRTISHIENTRNLFKTDPPQPHTQRRQSMMHNISPRHPMQLVKALHTKPKPLPRVFQHDSLQHSSAVFRYQAAIQPCDMSQTQQRLIDSRVVLLTQQRQQLVTQTITRVYGGVVRCVVPVGHLVVSKKGHNVLPAALQQRTDDLKITKRPNSRNTSQPLKTRTTQQPMENGLDVVVGMVSKSDLLTPVLPRRPFKKTVTLAPCFCFDRPATIPNRLPYVDPFNRQRQLQLPGVITNERFVLVALLAAQTMVEMGQTNGALPKPATAAKLEQTVNQRHAVRPARQGHKDPVTGSNHIMPINLVGHLVKQSLAGVLLHACSTASRPR